jgi:cytochrome c5
MKNKFIAAVAFGILIFSCSPKVVVQPSQPAVSQTPEATPSVTVASSDEVVHGKDLYNNSCARCHKLFAPTDFTRQDWAPILVRMQKKAKLDDAQMASITTYIHSEAN